MIDATITELAGVWGVVAMGVLMGEF